MGVCIVIGLIMWLAVAGAPGPMPEGSTYNVGGTK